MSFDVSTTLPEFVRLDHSTHAFLKVHDVLTVAVQPYQGDSRNIATLLFLPRPCAPATDRPEATSSAIRSPLRDKATTDRRATTYHPSSMGEKPKHHNLALLRSRERLHP